MPLVKINTPVHYHVNKYRICKNKICQGPVSCFDGNMVVSAGMAHIMTHALENFNGTISIGGRKITNLRFADDIDGITGEEDELTELVHNLDTAAEKFGMEISAEKTKIMTNNGTLQRDITIQGQKLETVNHFKYLGAIICDEGSRREVLSRAAQTMAALARLKIIWKDKNIRIKHKIRLMR